VGKSNGSGEQKRVGVLGGTFDPVHNAHLAIAGEAKKRLQLDEVIFVPAGQPWMKSDRTLAPAEHRLAMVQLAIRRRDYFKLSSVEVEVEEPSYTVETLRTLKKKLGRQTELFLIIGSDNLMQFNRWKEPVEILKLATLIVAPRPGVPHPDMQEIEKKVPFITGRTVLLDRPEIDLSSTEVRQRLAKGESIDDLVPAAVADYIREHGLYLKEETG
jgi:nicotinate-nucleotide adenylyltransferase